MNALARYRKKEAPVTIRPKMRPFYSRRVARSFQNVNMKNSSLIV